MLFRSDDPAAGNLTLLPGGGLCVCYERMWSCVCLDECLCAGVCVDVCLCLCVCVSDRKQGAVCSVSAPGQHGGQ